MSHQFDMVIRSGLVADGSGAEPRVADVAIRDGIIVAVGEIEGSGRQEIDAQGLLVTPGFVDLHTHYDGQAVWSNRMNPSSSHGVTTVVMGNCGVGFAPCRPQDRDLLCATMEGVEDIPGVVMSEGLTWDWETFPEFLDVLDRQPRDIDVGAFVPHSAVRVFAMGSRGANRDPANQQDLEAMSAIVRDAVAAGALGFATSRTSVDRRSDGELIPSFDIGTDELVAMAKAVRDGGGGIFQLIPELGLTGLSPEEEFEMLARIVNESGIPLTYTLSQANRWPHRWREWMDLTQAFNAEHDVKIHPQYFPRPVGLLASFDLTSNPFVHCPTYKSIAHLPLAERIERLRQPEIRARIIAEEPDEALMPLTALVRQFSMTYPMNNPPRYEPEPGSNVADQAQRLGVTPAEVAYDMMLEDAGTAMLLVAIGNFSFETLDHLWAFFDDPDTVMGLGDGGAHYGLICDSSYPTFVLTHWVRDRPGKRLSVGQAVKLMTSVPAKVGGLLDRGLIAPGYKADVNVIDHDRLALHAPYVTDDLPAGGRRLDQRATGYRWTICSGEVIAQDDRHTGALPGRLIRGRQNAAR